MRVEGGVVCQLDELSEERLTARANYLRDRAFYRSTYGQIEFDVAPASDVYEHLDRPAKR